MKLGVNVDHVATLRQARKGYEPDPVKAARICQAAGAHAIVMHLREDRRHIQEKDLLKAKEVLKIKLNMEMSLAASIVKIAETFQPEQVTLVPEKRQEMTTESGLNLLKEKDRLKRAIESFKKKNILVSLFIDPDPRQIEMAGIVCADAVEFHTGTYAEKMEPHRRQKELTRLTDAVRQAGELGLSAHAGHGLDYQNVKAITKIKGIEELNIGYSIVCRSLWVGLEQAVHEMLDLIRE